MSYFGRYDSFWLHFFCYTRTNEFCSEFDLLLLLVNESCFDMISLGSNRYHSFFWGVLSEGLEVFSDCLGIKGDLFISLTKGIPSIGISSSISYCTLFLSTSMSRSPVSITSKDSSSISENGKSTISFALMVGSL